MTAGAFVAIASIAAPAAAEPTQIEYMCSPSPTMPMRYVKSLSQCAPNETKVSVYPGPVYLCVSTTIVSLGSSSAPCGAGRQKVKVPGGPPSFYCAKKANGQLRGVGSLPCTSGENSMAIGPDVPPSVTSTSPTNGTQNVPLNSTVSVTFDQSVQATTSSFKLECPAGTPKSFSLSSSPAATFTLTPASNLPVNTTCKVTVVAANVVDADGDLHMVSDYSFSFKTIAAPSVTSTSPANGATGVATQATITINFSQSVNATGSAFKLECPAGTPKSFSQSATPATSVTLTPSAPMPVSTTCKVTVVASQVTDASSGTPMLADYVFSFTIDDPPTVTTTTPTNGANGVATTSSVTVNFSEQVAASTSSFKLECPSGTPIAYSLSSSPASSFTLTPNANLPSGTVCTVTVVAAQVHDTDANTPLQSDYVFSFTVDTVATVQSTVPANGATVAPSSTVTINFSESVTASTSSFKLECPSGTPIAYSLSSSPASSFTLTPNSSLPTGVTCAVKVVAAQVHDVDSGSPMAADYNFSFSTAAPPTVTSTTPTDGATGVTLGSTIQVTFSKQVNASTSSFKLECPAGTPKSYSLSSSPATTFTLTPNANLPSGTTCKVTVVASQVTSTDFGLNMTSDYVFSFATATAPTVTTTSPTNGATNVPTNATITVNFDRSVDASTSSFTVECPTGSPVPYSLSSSPASSYTITPNSNLPGGVTCTVTVVAAQVTDHSNGTPMDTNYVFSFTTDVPPAVTTTSPTDGATDVNAGTTITVNFSESVNATGSAFSLECPTGTPESFSTSSSPASSYTLTPTSPLPGGTTCTVTVHASGISDVDAGSPLGADYQFSFTTDTPPTVTTTVPTNGATDVNAGSTITINFSKSVTAASGAFSLECPTGTPISFSTSSSPASSYTLTPTSPLPASTTCTIVIDKTKITDASSTNMTSDYTFSFTVDTPPAVTTTSPVDTATSVPLNSTITVNFSKSVSATTSSFTLECPTGTPISYSLSSSPASSYTLTPTSNLPPDTTCTVTVVANQVSDASNTHMVTNYVFSFHTVLPPPDAVDDGPSSDYSATGGVPININAAKGVLSNDTLYGGSISSYGKSTGLEDSSIGTATATAQGGFVTLNADGSFHYDPPSVPPGGGTDSFKYTLTNTSGSDTATVTLNVTKQIIFVDGSANSVPETGSLDHPYNALGDVPSGRGTGGVLFFYSGSYTTNSDNGVTLKNSEYLIGQGVALGSNLPFTLAPDSVSLPGSNTNPTISTTLAAANAIELASGNTIKGLTAGSSPNASIFGSSFGTLSISSASINNAGSGAALSLNTGAFGASSSLSSVSASPTSGADGISLTTVTGSLTINGGSISANSTGDAFFVGAGSVSVTDSGNLSQANSGVLLNVTSGHTGTLTFQTGTLSATNGSGLQFNNADGTYTLSNGSTLNGGNAAVSVTNGSSGTMTLNSSPITNPGSTAFNVNGSSATVSDSGAISKTSSGLLVDIESNSGGSVGLSGNLSATSSASGIKLASNSGGTYTFSGGTKTVSTGTNDAVAMTSNTGATATFSGGGLAVTTSSGAGVKATGGGTVNVTGSSNTITSTTGTALDVESTTIGASGLTFQSISASGGSHGIVLDTTGTNAGLTVTGTGSANSGGTIQAIGGSDLASNNCGSVSTSGGPVGVGVYLNSTKNVSLTWMTFPGTFGNFGILGHSVNGFVLDHSTMTGTYGDNVNVDEDAVSFCTLTGSASISNDTIQSGAEDNVRVVNASGTLNRLSMVSDTIGFPQTTAGDHGVLLTANGGTLNATVEDTTFSGAGGSPFSAAPQAGATMDLVFGQPGHGNTIHNTFSNIAPFAQDINVAAGGTLTVDINSNHFDSANAVQAQGGVFLNSGLGGASVSGYIRNNTIGNSGVANSGSSGNDPGLDVESNGGGNLTVVIDNNQMYQWGSNGAGFLLQAGAGSPTVNATVTNNTIAQPGTFAVSNNAQGFQLNNGTQSGENFTTCLKFQSNTFNGSGTGAGGDGRFRQRFDTKVNMPGYTGPQDGVTGSPTVAQYIQGLNPTGPPSITSVSSTAGGGGFFNTPGGAACTLPGF